MSCVCHPCQPKACAPCPEMLPLWPLASPATVLEYSCPLWHWRLMCSTHIPPGVLGLLVAPTRCISGPSSWSARADMNPSRRTAFAAGACIAADTQAALHNPHLQGADLVSQTGHSASQLMTDQMGGAATAVYSQGQSICAEYWFTPAEGSSGQLGSSSGQPGLAEQLAQQQPQ